MTLNDYRDDIYQCAVDKGWWENGERNFGEVCSLITSEISEALEEWRNGRGYDEIYFSYKHPDTGAEFESRFPTANVVRTKEAGGGVTELRGKPEGIPVEFADAVIRILDFFGWAGTDADAVVDLKTAYNHKRPYRHGGKLA
jgi:hypothetical protein